METRQSNKEQKEWEGGQSRELRIVSETGSILSLVYVATLE